MSVTVIGSQTSGDYSALYEGPASRGLDGTSNRSDNLTGGLPSSGAAGTGPAISGHCTRNPFVSSITPVTGIPLARTPQSDFFEGDLSQDFYLRARMVHVGGSPKRGAFQSLHHLAPFVPPPIPPRPQQTIWERIQTAMGCIPRPIVRVGDEMTIMREGLSPRAQKLFDDLPQFHTDFQTLAIRGLFARMIDQLLSNRPDAVRVTKRDQGNPFSKTFTQLPNGAVTVKLELLAIGGNKKVYEQLCIFPNAEIKNVVEQRYLKRGGIMPIPQFSLAQEALLADLFDSPYVVKGPIAYFNRENGNQSVIMQKYDSDFSKGLKRFNLKNALTILEHVSLGLAHIHSKGCVHRDIKLLNIFLESLPDGSHRGVVGDLGLLVSEFSCTELRRNILQAIELEFMRRGLLGPLGEIKFTILSRYVDLSGGLYPLNIDMQIFERKGVYPTLANFQEFVKDTAIATIKEPYSQPRGLGKIGYQRGSGLIFSAGGAPLFPLLAEYLKTNEEFPSNSEFVTFMKQKILEIVIQVFKLDRKIFNEKGAILFSPLRDMIKVQELRNFPSKEEFSRFLQRFTPVTAERYRSLEGYAETITFLETLDRVTRAFRCIPEEDLRRGELPPQTEQFVDPVDYKATMEFLKSLNRGLFEVRVWAHGGPAKVKMPLGVPPFVPSALTEKLQLDLYPVALEFLKEVTNKFEVIDSAGTFIYMAPEQIHAKIITSKADIYAVGMMLRDVVSEPYIKSALVSRRALAADLEELQKEMTKIQYKERPTAEQCAERFQRIIATHCG